MRKILNTLFVLSENSYLSLDGEDIVIKEDSKIKAKYPLHIFENIMSFSYAGASPSLMGKCGDLGIGISFYKPNGKFLASCSGIIHGNVLLRRQQFRFCDDYQKKIGVAKYIIGSKFYNSRWVIERFTRDHPLQVDIALLKNISQNLHDAILLTKNCNDAESLLGIEGNLARQYFGIFDELILNKDFVFEKRSKRPPLNAVNALLSFGYTILTNECSNALLGVGLDPYVGVFHTERPGRISLALDLVESLRAPFVDKFVLFLINKRIIKKEYFIEEENGAVLLNDEGRKVFFKYWQEKKKETIIHPVIKEKVSWGLVPYIQALLFARFIRGDLEEYPVFLWK